MIPLSLKKCSIYYSINYFWNGAFPKEFDDDGGVRYMGIHVIAELLGVDARKISRVEIVRPILNRVISKSGLNCISSHYHQFEKYGVSAVYLLSESHLSLHTWPEYGYIALDIFTCGPDEPALKAFRLIVEEFRPRFVKKKIIRRVPYAKGGCADFEDSFGIEEVHLGTA